MFRQRGVRKWVVVESCLMNMGVEGMKEGWSRRKETSMKKSRNIDVILKYTSFWQGFLKTNSSLMRN